MFLVPITRNPSALLRSFDRWFDDDFVAPARSESRSPALDVSETERAYAVRLDMPGVAKEDVQVSIDGRRVTIEAQSNKQDEKKDGDRIVYRERASARYARSFVMAAEIDQAESAAKLENGVLTLTLAKRGAPASTRISVN